MYFFNPSSLGKSDPGSVNQFLLVRLENRSLPLELSSTHCSLLQMHVLPIKGISSEPNRYSHNLLRLFCAINSEVLSTD